MKIHILIVRLLFVTSVVAISGCSNGIAGSWQTAEVRPQGAAFPIHQVTFDAQGKYTATGQFTSQGSYTGNTHTTTGDYTKKGRTVRVSPIGGPAVEYDFRRRLDGKLEMTLKLPGKDRDITAVLTPAAP